MGRKTTVAILRPTIDQLFSDNAGGLLFTSVMLVQFNVMIFRFIGLVLSY